MGMADIITVLKTASDPIAKRTSILFGTTRNLTNMNFGGPDELKSEAYC